MGDRWLSPSQAAALVGCHERTIRRLCGAGELAAIDARGPGSRLTRWRIERRSLEKFLDHRKTSGQTGHALIRGPVFVSTSEEVRKHE